MNIIKRTSSSIMSLWISVIMLVLGIATALFTMLLIYYRTADVIEATDARLLMAAEMTREMVGPDYHNQIDAPSSISPEQFKRIVERNDDLCRRLHLQYLWSVLSVDDQFVFTSATHSDIGNPASPSAAFFEVHRDPEAFRLAMGPEMKPVFSTFNNEWGQGRQVLVPRKDENGRTYIFGASVQMEDYNALLRQAVLAAIATGLAVMGGAFLLTLALVRRLTIPITQLTKTADKMAGGDLEVSLPLSGVSELQSLSDSLDQLRHGLKKRNKELNKSTALLDATQQLTRVGGWEWDVAQQSMFWTDEAYRIHGFSPEEIPPGSTDHIDRSILCYEPDARPIIQAAFQDCIEKGLPYSLEVPFTNLQGERMWVRTQAEVVRENEKIVRVVGNIIDITARKLAEEAISQSEEKYRLLIKNSHDIIYTSNTEGFFTFVSPAWTTLLGHPVSQVTGHSFQQFVHPDDIPSCMIWLQKVLETRTRQEGIEYRVRHMDGEWFWHTSSAVPLVDAAGVVVGFEGIARDITERKQAEEALRKSEALLSEAQKRSHIGSWELDIQLDKPTWSDEVFRIFEIDRQRLGETYSTFLAVIHPEDRQATKDAYSRSFETGTPYEITYRLLMSDGRIKFVREQGETTYGSDGKPLHSIGIVQDITERKKAEDGLIAAEKLAQELLAASSQSRQALLSVVEDQKETEAELRQYRDHLEELVKERTAELEIAKEQAESADRAKSDFLAVMSHEIRTPLNGVVGLTYLALQTELNDKQRDYLTRLQTSAEILQTTINDILNFSKIEAGKLNLEQIDFSLDDVLHGISDLLAARANEKNLELVFQPEMNVPRLLVGDPQRLGQVLLNLVANAIKFTEQGEVVLKVRLIEQAERTSVLGDSAAGDSLVNNNPVVLEFSVRDTGIGMTEEQIAHLFQPFRQADNSISRKYGGTGLGLTISQRLVKMLGGDIWVRSQIGAGSVFTCIIAFGQQSEPIPDGSLAGSFGAAQAASDTIPALFLRELAGLRILVVDQHAATQEFLRSALESFAFKVTTAQSAEEGLLLLDQAGDDPFGLVLMNWKLQGGLDGLEAARRIRQDLRLAGTPIILLGGQEDVQQKASTEGLNGSLLKPITRSQLFDAVMQVFGHQAQTRPRPAHKIISTETLGKLRGKHILLVEDNEINQMVAVEILQQMGLLVSVAYDGEQAVQMAGQGSYDAILMDIQMPGMDGYQATAQIRGTDLRPDPDQIPIIAMTANALNSDNQKAMEAGMSDYVSKPVDVAQLARVLARWLDQPSLESEPGKDIQPIDDPQEPIPAQLFAREARGQDLLPAALDSLDMLSALTRLGDNKALYRRILFMFRAEHAQDGTAIRTALQSNDLEFAQRLAHNLKGLAGTIGADGLRAAAKNLEMAIAEGNEPDCEDLLVQVEQKLAVVMASIAMIA